MTKESIDITVGRGGDEGALKWWFVLSGLSLSLHKSCCSLPTPPPPPQPPPGRPGSLQTPLWTNRLFWVRLHFGGTTRSRGGGREGREFWGWGALLLCFVFGRWERQKASVERQALEALGLGWAWGGSAGVGGLWGLQAGRGERATDYSCIGRWDCVCEFTLGLRWWV